MLPDFALPVVEECLGFFLLVLLFGLGLLFVGSGFFSFPYLSCGGSNLCSKRGKLG